MQLEWRHDLEIFGGLSSAYVEHFLPLTSFINICIRNIIRFRIFYLYIYIYIYTCVCVCVCTDTYACMIKRISCSKLKETYLAIPLHINSRHSSSRRVWICYQNTLRHFLHEFYLYRYSVRNPGLTYLRWVRECSILFIFGGQGANRTNVICTREYGGLVLRKKDDTDVCN
jgi:hypothetical protein